MKAKKDEKNKPVPLDVIPTGKYFETTNGDIYQKVSDRFSDTEYNCVNVETGTLCKLSLDFRMVHPLKGRLHYNYM